MSLCLRATGFNFLMAVCVGRPRPSLPSVRWPLACARRAGAAYSGVCGGLLGLDPQFVSLALVLWCALVRRAVWCRVSSWFVVLVRAVLWCVLLCRAVLRRVVPWCAALCRVAPRRAVVCRVLGSLVVVRCMVVRCGAVCRVASCCAVVGAWGGVGGG